MMNDFFFKMVDARGELAASRVALENLVSAIEKSPELPVTSQLLLDVAVKLAKEQIETNTKMLESDIYA
jgi:hypothetical protein